MKMKKFICGILMSLVVCIMCSMATISAFAEGDMDGLTGGDSGVSQSASGGAGALGDYLEDYNPITDENMEEANALATPITNLIGNLIGIITLVTASGIFLVTACDLTYIGLPFLRPLLTAKWQLVSDEAISVVGQMGQGGQQGGMGSPMGGGMGSPMGSPMGGMASPMGGGMGSPMGAGGQAGGMSVKSAIGTYFKKRIVFIVIFTIATILLTSSALTGVGINLAALLFKVINKLNGGITGIDF